MRAAFFARSPLEVAPELLGWRLLRVLPDGTRLEGVIVEVEAYLGDGTDPGSHSHRGPTPRNRAMFGPPAHFYVYRSMGIHWCANVVCEPRGTGAAVLLRALEPRAGETHMQAARGGRSGRELTSGPGRLAQAFAIGKEHDGTSALRGALRLAPPSGRRDFEVARSPRIGLSQGADLPYRFFARGNPFVSRAGRAASCAPILRAR